MLILLSHLNDIKINLFKSFLIVKTNQVDGWTVNYILIYVYYMIRNRLISDFNLDLHSYTRICFYKKKNLDLIANWITISILNVRFGGKSVSCCLSPPIRIFFRGLYSKQSTSTSATTARKIWKAFKSYRFYLHFLAVVGKPTGKNMYF